MKQAELAQEILDYINDPSTFFSDDLSVKNWVEKVEDLCNDVITYEEEVRTYE